MLVTKGKDRTLGLIIYSNVGNMVYVPKETTYHFLGGRSKRTLLLSRFSCVQLLATPWTAAHQAPPSMGFSRQDYRSGVPLPSPKVC